MLMATENVIHVRYQPNQDSPRDIVFRLSGEHFQPSQEIKKQFQQLDNFYANQFEPANSEEDNEEYNVNRDGGRGKGFGDLGAKGIG
jgi:hypothetical protein